MQVTIVPSDVTATRRRPKQFLTSYLIDDSVAIDAGSLGLYRTPREQAAVKHVLLSHTHIDHVASLPLFLTNIYSGDGNCPIVYGSEAVLDCLRRDLFNDRLWPDFIGISTVRPPFLKLEAFEAGQTLQVNGLRITPVSVNHPVPTVGFVVEDEHGAVVFSSDTGPTEELWERANRTAALKAVFLEATLPNSKAWLADHSGHLTPALFAQEVRKLERSVPIIAVHIHPLTDALVVKELKALGVPQLEIGRFGVPYTF